MNIDAIEIGTLPPEDINVIIEVSVGGEPIKYELDKSSGTLVVDRFLYTPMRYPGNYGFVPHTLSEDGDPIDVLVCNTRTIVPGAIINCRPIGVLDMEDDGGRDEKILAVPSSSISMRYDKIRNADDLPDITVAQIRHFFEHYKDLEPDKWVRILGLYNADRAKQLILDSIDRAEVDTDSSGMQPSVMEVLTSESKLDYSFDVSERLTFHDELRIMEVDFSDLVFSSGEDVDYV